MVHSEGHPSRMSPDQPPLPDGTVVVVSYHLHCPACATAYEVPGRVATLLFPGERGVRPGTAVTCPACQLQYRIPLHVALGKPEPPPGDVMRPR